jgi:acetyl esterase/lipase
LARSLEARPILESALREEIDIEPSMGPVPLGRLALFFPKRPSCVERLRDVPYARPHRHAWSMDIYRHEDRPKNAPMIVEVHGGGWVLGDKREQGLPLMYHMAERGWLCASANYRLSPGATFPDQLIDLKRAVAHLRAHGRDYGGDPSFIIITGGSAGGHLASLVALTAGDPRYQPGFEEADTRVAGCVSAYGVYDLADSDGHWLHDGFHKLMETQVLKATRKEAPELFAEASPICRVAKDAPPFFIVHGDCDSLVPVGGARAFAAALRRESSSPVVYAELPEAQHAFDVFYCVRSLLVVQAVEEFSRHLYESGRSG